MKDDMSLCPYLAFALFEFSFLAADYDSTRSLLLFGRKIRASASRRLGTERPKASRIKILRWLNLFFLKAQAISAYA